MGTAHQRGFHHMRYVLAVLGMIAVALPDMSELAREDVSSEIHEYSRSFDHIVRLTIHFTSLVVVILFGIFMNKLSAKWTVTTVILLNCLVTVSHRILAMHGYLGTLLVLSSVATIMGPMVNFLALHALIANWSPPAERTLITSIIWSGAGVGRTYSLEFSSLNADIFAGIFGIISVVWMVLWILMIDDSPQSKKHFISSYEKNYIRTAKATYWSQPGQNEGLSMGRILITKEFLLVIFVSFAGVCANTIYYRLPISSIQAPDWRRPALITFIDQIAVGITWGAVMTACLQKKVISFDVARKISGIIPNILILPIQWSSHGVISDLIHHVATGISSSGTIVNIIDISPNFAPLLFAIFLVIRFEGALIFDALLDFVVSPFGPQARAIILISSASVLVVVSSMAYMIWGSTAQKTSIPEKPDPREGKIHSAEISEIQPTACACLPTAPVEV